MFISCAGTRIEGVFDGTVRVARYFFKMLEIRMAGIYCYPGVDRKGDILDNGAALNEIRGAAFGLLQD
jgi:hypothetical protein